MKSTDPPSPEQLERLAAREPKEPVWPQQAAAARALYQRLRKAEKGRNEHGPSWLTSEMVKALYAFYEDMEGN